MVRGQVRIGGTRNILQDSPRFRKPTPCLQVDNSLTFQGPLQAINVALATLEFQTTEQFHPFITHIEGSFFTNDKVTIAANDLGASGAGGAQVPSALSLIPLREVKRMLPMCCAVCLFRQHIDALISADVGACRWLITHTATCGL